MKEPIQGHIHLLSRTIAEIQEICGKIGFGVATGPEIEDEYHNFDALNVSKDHPSRDMQDTFWLKPLVERKLLRTHTSPVQVRYMEENIRTGVMPPYKIIVPGKVFRNEATDATHEAQFFQLEGLYVDKEVSLADLKGTLLYFFRALLGPDCDIRFRPSFFPFVEPGVEVDVKFNGKWLEMMGAGLVHPRVFEAVGLSGYTGFAFGGGIDRMIMVKYGIPDVRYLYSGDLRLVQQF